MSEQPKRMSWIKIMIKKVKECMNWIKREIIHFTTYEKENIKNCNIY